MTEPTTIAERYVTVWNETDAARRRALLEQGWSADATYVDPVMSGRGLDQIDGLIAAVQARFPGFRFALSGKADGYGDRLRFSWSLGPAGGEAPIAGTDFVELDGGRLRRVTGFLDRVPAA